MTQTTLEPMGDAVLTPKQAKNEVSCVRNGKFEFSAIKNHYIDINVILDTLQKKPQRGVLSPKEPPGDANQDLSWSAVLFLY